MTREQGNKRENGLPTGGQANLRREENMLTGRDGADSMNGEVGGEIGIMDTAVIAMVNLYLKNIPLSERCSILENVVSQRNTEDEPEIRAHIDGAKLADLIDKAKAYLAELLNVKMPTLRDKQPEEAVETVFGIDMSNIKCGMINTANSAELEDGAKLKGRVIRVDDMDDDAPKYNPALEMSFNNLINKSWEVLFDLMRNLSGTEYVTHMPYEMAEMIVKHYYKLM